MTMQRVVDILKIEKECVERQDTPQCNRDCGNCDLLLPTEEVKQAYTLAIGCIEGTQSLLDKIRAEIEEERKVEHIPEDVEMWDYIRALDRTLSIIDKYRGDRHET